MVHLLSHTPGLPRLCECQVSLARQHSLAAPHPPQEPTEAPPVTLANLKGLLEARGCFTLLPNLFANHSQN